MKCSNFSAPRRSARIHAQARADGVEAKAARSIAARLQSASWKRLFCFILGSIGVNWNPVVTHAAKPPQSSSNTDSKAKASQESTENCPSLSVLMQEFQKVEGLSASYSEKKYISLLAVPLESQGALYFLAPHSMAKITTSSPQSRILLSHGNLEFHDAQGSHQLDLTRNPALMAFVQSFSALLRGDLAALQANFQVRFHCVSPDSWNMDIVPKSAELKRMLRSMQIQGRGIVLESVEVTEPNGDRSETEFRNVNPKQTFSEQERREWFKLPTPKRP